ncbi:MAG TPA: cysteine rich repeat-containing protein [Woeseiaceae bacterium]|nr:cysteine rich repeat-containing protein [Woeseiaceae bacterium]
MNNKLKLAAGIFAVAFAAPALSQDSLLEYVVTSCEADIKQYCSQVTPGEGRLLHCAAAHEDKLSGQCSYALYQAASLLEQLSMAIVYVAQSCETEIETLCGDVKSGEGRILSCLEENGEALGDSCNKALAETVGE